MFVGEAFFYGLVMNMSKRMVKTILAVLLVAVANFATACEEYRKPNVTFPGAGLSPDEIRENIPEILTLFEGSKILYMNFWSSQCVDVLIDNQESEDKKAGITIYLDKNEKGWFISGAHHWGRGS